MTDLPQDPADPTRGEPTSPPPPGPSPDAVPPAPPAAAAPPAPSAAAQAPPAAPPDAPYVPSDSVAAQPGYPPQPDNPYGGYSQAPVYSGGVAYPGSLAYVEQNYGRVASFGQRALAYLVDTALTLIGLVPMIIGIVLIVVGAPNDISTDQFGNTTTSGDSNAGLIAVGVLLITLGVIVAIGITIWNRFFKMGRTGQSVGKKVVGLYLLDDKTGQPIGAGRAFLRELVQGLVNQVIYIGWLWMLWDADKQTLGDKAVHSSVVVVPKT